MKKKSICVSCVLWACLGLFASDASAQLFGGNDKKWERILLEIKKLNTRIVEQVIPQFKQINSEINKVKMEVGRIRADLNTVKSGNKNLNGQMEILANVIPGIQSSMEQSQVRAIRQIQDLGKRLDQLEAKIKAGQDQQAQNQQAALNAIRQEIGANLKTLKEGMAKDMEQIAKLNQSSFRELVKSSEKQLNHQNAQMEKTVAVMTEIAKGGSRDSEALAALQARLAANSKARSEQNKKIIDILFKSLKEQEAAAAKMDSLGGHQAQSDENVKLARDTMVALKDILDKRLAEIEKTQQVLLTQNDQVMQNADLIKQNQLIADQKINKLAEGLKAITHQATEAGASISNVRDQLRLIHELNKHTDEKFSLLVDTTKSMLINSNQMNLKADMSLQRIDDGKAEARLTSEKISRLIEILKAIAKEQGKLEQLVASQAGKGNNKKLMDALADLRRKANVNISRSDSILKKLKGSRK